MSTAVSDDIWSSTNVLDKLKFWLYDGGIKNHGIAKVSLGNDECLSQILWKSMQILSKHFTQNYKSQPDDGARIKVRESEKSVGFIVLGPILQTFINHTFY